MQHLKLVFFALPLVLLSGCFGFGSDVNPPNAQNYEPVIMSRAAFENSVQLLPVQNSTKTGKIYVKEQFLFINEVNKGFHVYNYSDPANPVPIAFIQLLGATDLAVRGHTIFINQAVDLVTLVYNPNANTIAVTHRNPNVFPQKNAPDNSYTAIAPNEIIIDWIHL